MRSWQTGLPRTSKATPGQPDFAQRAAGILTRTASYEACARERARGVPAWDLGPGCQPVAATVQPEPARAARRACSGDPRGRAAAAVGPKRGAVLLAATPTCKGLLAWRSCRTQDCAAAEPCRPRPTRGVSTAPLATPALRLRADLSQRAVVGVHPCGAGSDPDRGPCRARNFPLWEGARAPPQVDRHCPQGSSRQRPSGARESGRRVGPAGGPG